MAIAPFLAMTAAEMFAASSLPHKIAWMACHFSPYGLGLSNLPQKLPPGSLLVVDDIIPPHGHDSVLIAKQLAQCVETLQCCGILLDFQREDSWETSALAKHLVQALPYPAVVSEPYAGNLECPVFLPPVPPSVPLETYIRPWIKREIWLELGLEGELLTLTENGCEILPLPYPDPEGNGFADETLHCHHTIKTEKKTARFTLWRSKEDMGRLLTEAEALGIAGAVGLYQELSPWTL